MTAKIKLNAASGGGSFSLQAPSSSSNNRVFTLPDSADGNVATTDSSGNFSVSGTTTCSGNLKAGTITDTSGNNSSTTEQIFQGRARVWWNYNQDGSPAAIRDSYRVSSITDNASGKYTVNFQDTLTDPCGAVSASFNANAFDTNYSDVATPYISNTACQVITANMEGVPYGGLHDCDYGYGVIHSDD